MEVRVQSLIGRKKFPRNLKHDVSTTADFGFVQPIVSRRLHAEDTASLKLANVVMLNPLVKPTYGSMSLKSYVSFVPIADIWHPYESMMSGQTYSGAGATYIPTEIPNIHGIDLMRILMLFSDVYLVYGTLQNDTDVHNNLRYAKYSIGNVISPEDASAVFMAYFFDKKFNAAIALNDNESPYFGTIDSAYRYPSWSKDPAASNYVNFETMDFYDSFTYIDEDEQSHNVVMGFKLNRFGRNLRKILIGCGFQLNFDTGIKLDFARLVAYYKVWFDLFMPARDLTWKDTPAFNVMEYIEQNNSSIAELLYYTDEPVVTGTYVSIVRFFENLSMCYYTQNPDYVSAHITGNRNAIVPGGSFAAQAPTAGNTNNVSISNDNRNDGPHLSISSFGSISQPLLDVLKKMTTRMNVHTAIGGRIRDFMRVVFNSDYIDGHDSHRIGSESTPISVDPVFSTAETSQAYLAEYAAKGVGGKRLGDSRKFTYSARAEGYLFVLQTVVPDTHFAQGVDMELRAITKYTNYDQKFDGVTLLPTPKMAVYGIQEARTSLVDYSGGFGNIPIYSETKIAMNKINGDMSLPSTRESYLPFNIDKLLPYPRRKMYQESEGGTIVDYLNVYQVNPELLSASTVWRYIGLYPWIGLLNRIFVNSDVIKNTDLTSVSGLDYAAHDDNFIIHNYIDLSVVGYPIPMADSFQTEAFDSDTVKVEKA